MNFSLQVESEWGLIEPAQEMFWLRERGRKTVNAFIGLCLLESEVCLCVWETKKWQGGLEVEGELRKKLWFIEL